MNGRNCHNVSADYDVVEKEIISALRTWLEGYRIKIETVGFSEEIAAYRSLFERSEQELTKLNNQMENAFNLVEQGIYTLEVFKDRRAKLTAAMEKVEAEQKEIMKILGQLEQSEHTRSNLIPQTEELLASYDSMTNQERNDILKTILYKIEYTKREADGKIEIDLYPRLPRI